MLYLILLWALIALASLRLSLLLLPVHDHGKTVESTGFDAVFVHLWLGLALTGGVLTGLAFFFPLRPELGLIGLLVLLLDLIRRRIRVSIALLLPPSSLRGGLTVLAPVALAALFASQQVTYFDTAYYHLQLSRLLAEYGAIPGIVALHANFGQSSLWFAMVAPTLVDGSTGFGVTTFNGYVCALAAVQAVLALKRTAAGKAGLPDWIAGIGYAVVLICALRWGMVASASPDLPVMIVTVTAAWLLARSPAGLTGSAGPATLLCAFAAAIKLSAAPLLAIAGLKLLWDGRKAFRPAIPFAALAFLCVAGVAMLGERASGCLAYPVSFTCFDRAWTPAPEALASHTELIASAARGGGRTLPPETPALEVFTTWMTRDKSGALLVGGAVILGLGFAAFGTIRRDKISAQQWWIAALAAVGTVFVLATAPTGRFIGGFTAVWLGLWAHQIAARAGPRPAGGLLVAGIGGSVLLVAALSVATAPHFSLRGTIADRIDAGIYPDPGSGWVIPKRLIPFDIHRPELPRLSAIETMTNGFVTANKPVSTGECWAAAPPCVPGQLLPTVRYLSPELAETGGFYRLRPEQAAPPGAKSAPVQ